MASHLAPLLPRLGLHVRGPHYSESGPGRDPGRISPQQRGSRPHHLRLLHHVHRGPDPVRASRGPLRPHEDHSFWLHGVRSRDRAHALRVVLPHADPDPHSRGVRGRLLLRTPVRDFKRLHASEIPGAWLRDHQ